MKPKLLFLMHVPWGWIKQRPHYFAENLSRDFDVTVGYRKPTTVNENKLKEDKNKDFIIRSFISIPFQRVPLLKKIPYIKLINTFIFRFFFKNIKEYDYIWVCSPSLFDIVKPLIQSNQKIIYDCMDDIISFPSNSEKRIQKDILLNESELIKRADLNIFSAEYLKKTVLDRYKLYTIKSILLNNAIEAPKESNVVVPKEILARLHEFSKIANSFLYIGTIERWIDFELIQRILNENSKINFVFIGPKNINLPNHPRIHYFGIIKRDYIFYFMKQASALIMPFKVTELIKSVNPVKLYEYIWENKPIIAPLYGESLKFEKYVYLYDSIQEFKNICEGITSRKLGPKATITDCQEFVQNNTWTKRYEELKERINSL